MTFVQKFFQFAHLNHQIVLRRPSAYLHLFDFGAFLGKTRFFFDLFLLVTILVKTHYSRHRRIGFRRYLYQIQTLFSRQSQGFLAADYAEILPVARNNPKLWRDYFVVDAWLIYGSESFYFRNKIIVVGFALGVNTPLEIGRGHVNSTSSLRGFQYISFE